ncbi:MAG TPA: NAD(P)-binding domain-containing protein, partial [Terriglobia bacterium]|nr:NAD(P)-binding domain-containing protein [Terriglobia bacterium]
MLSHVKKWVDAILTSGDMAERRPALKSNNESNIKGLYVIGDLAGAPVIKLAMAQGVEVVEHIAAQPDARSSDPKVYDLIVAGAGAAGLNAALAAKEKGLRTMVLEKGKIANTIENFPESKWVYAEPDQTPPKGKLWLDGARKEDLIRRWHQI